MSELRKGYNPVPIKTGLTGKLEECNEWLIWLS